MYIPSETNTLERKPPKTTRSQPAPKRKIGLVLGAGAARGWAHIGVIEALAALGISPDIICGCSSGAIVAASYATGRLDTLNDLARSLTWTKTLGYMDISLSGPGGLIDGRYIADFFRDNVEDTDIGACSIPFGAVATDLHSGTEHWLTEGSIVDAVRASIALPGLLKPIAIDGRWMVDGALTNPLPVPLCRSLGAEIIIGVNLSGDLTSQTVAPISAVQPAPAAEKQTSSWLSFLSGGSQQHPDHKAMLPPPSYGEVLSQSLFIMQNFVTRMRLAADPVDILITPDVNNVGVMDFHCAQAAIEAGHNAVDLVADKLTEFAPASAPQSPAHTAFAR